MTMNVKIAFIAALVGCVLVGAAFGNGWRGVVMSCGLWLIVSVLKDRRSDP